MPIACWEIYWTFTIIFQLKLILLHNLYRMYMCVCVCIGRVNLMHCPQKQNFIPSPKCRRILRISYFISKKDGNSNCSPITTYTIFEFLYLIMNILNELNNHFKHSTWPSSAAADVPAVVQQISVLRGIDLEKHSTRCIEKFKYLISDPLNCMLIGFPLKATYPLSMQTYASSTQMTNLWHSF